MACRVEWFLKDATRHRRVQGAVGDVERALDWEDPRTELPNCNDDGTSLYRRGRTARDHGVRPCAALDSARLGFKAMREAARTTRLRVHDSIRVIR